MKGFYEFGDFGPQPCLEEPALAHRILLGDVLAGTNSLADLQHEQSRAITVDRRPIRSSCVGQAAASNQEAPTRRYLPGIWVLRRYQRSWLRGDPLAGVTVAAYLVPQVMAYAEVAGLPATTTWGSHRRCCLCHSRLVAPALRRSRVQHRTDDGGRGHRAGRR